MSSDILKTLTISLTSSMCTALFVVACTAGATDSGKGGGSGDDDGGGDGSDDFSGGDDGDGGLAGLLSEVADMAVTIAAQQSSILALELQVAELKDNTFRWETYEVECVLGEFDRAEVEIEPGAVFYIPWESRGGDVWSRDDEVLPAHSGLTEMSENCSGYDDYVVRWRVAYDW